MVQSNIRMAEDKQIMSLEDEEMDKDDLMVENFAMSKGREMKKSRAAPMESMARA